MTYPGQHDAIIEREAFDAARRRRDDNAAQRQSPTHANKKGLRYRYYISKRLMQRTGSTDGGWRLPGKELVGTVSRMAGDILSDELRIIDTLELTGTDRFASARQFAASLGLAPKADSSAGSEPKGASPRTSLVGQYKSVGDHLDSHEQSGKIFDCQLPVARIYGLSLSGWLNTRLPPNEPSVRRVTRTSRVSVGFMSRSAVKLRVKLPVIMKQLSL